MRGRGPVDATLGSLTNDDSEGNENGKKKKKQLVSIDKTTGLHVYHAFLYIS